MSPCDLHRSISNQQNSLQAVDAHGDHPLAGASTNDRQSVVGLVHRRASNDPETRNLLVDLKLQLANALEKVDELTQTNKRLAEERDLARHEVATLKRLHEARLCMPGESTTRLHGTKSPPSDSIVSDTNRFKFDPSLGYGSSNTRGPSATSSAGPLQALGGAASVRNMFSSLRRESVMTTASGRSRASGVSEHSQSSLLGVTDNREEGGNDDNHDGPQWLQKLRNLPGSSTREEVCHDESNAAGGFAPTNKRMQRRGSTSAPNLLSISPSALAHFNESTLNLLALDMSESMKDIDGNGGGPCLKHQEGPPDALPSQVAACGAEFTVPLSVAKDSTLASVPRNNTANDVKTFMKRMSGLSDDFDSDDDSCYGNTKNAEWT